MEYRMYCLSERHLSIAQKTIQAAHAIIEYSLKYGNTEEYKQWSEYDKTIIVLDGGNSTEIREVIRKLSSIRYNYEIFTEPDMDNFVTSIAFLADERVWNYAKTGHNYEEYRLLNMDETVNSDGTYKSFPSREEWLNVVGGEGQAVLKEIISSKRIAQ